MNANSRIRASIIIITLAIVIVFTSLGEAHAEVSAANEADWGYGWKHVYDNVSDVVMGCINRCNDDLLFLIANNTGDIFEGSIDDTREIQIGGPGKSFVIVKDTLYGIAPDGSSVWEYSGVPMEWHDIGGPAVELIGGNFLYATNPDTGDIWKYSGSAYNWEWIGDPGKMFVADGNYLYGIPPDGSGVWFYPEMKGEWLNIGGPADAVYAGSGRLAATKNPGYGDIWLWEGTPQDWVKIGGPGKMFVFDAYTTLFGLSPSGDSIYQYTNTPMVWEPITGNVSVKAIYAGVHLCALTTDSELWCYEY